jgi:hypothetical protein
MYFNLHRKLAVAAVLFCLSLACRKSNPMRPSFVTPPETGQLAGVSLTLTRLSGNYMGMGNEICAGGAPVAIDDLQVDYEVRGKSLTGALLVACETEDCRNGSPLGTVSDCPLPPNPCEAGLPPAVSEGSPAACLIGDPAGSGSLRVFAARPADNSGSWQVMAYFANGGHRSNTVSGIVDLTPRQATVSEPPMDSARFGRSQR